MKELKELLNIKSDVVFKAVFGREEETCKKILRDLLNAILDLHEEKRIKDIIYKNPFNLQEIPSDKLSIMDIKVETECGEAIDIEMQVGYDKHFRKKSLYYWSQLYNEALSKAEAYRELKKCIVINIINYHAITESKDYHTIFNIMEKEEKFILLDDLEIHFIQLTSFDDSKDVDLMNEIERWVAFIKDSNDEQKRGLIELIKERSESIRMAAELLRKISEDEKEREKIMAIEKARREQLSKELDAKEDGIEIGKKETALEMLRDGLSIEKIHQYTKLPTETIKKLQK